MATRTRKSRKMSDAARKAWVTRRKNMRASAKGSSPKSSKTASSRSNKSTSRRSSK